MLANAMKMNSCFMKAIKCALMLVGVCMLCLAEDDAKLYLVLNLETGATRYSAEPPDLSDDACRTTELWMRHIPAGTFTMGSEKTELGVWKNHDMTPHPVTLTKDYYMGIFEVTQKQWTLLMEKNPSCYVGDTRPVDRVSYDMVRGGDPDVGGGWPKHGHTADDDSYIGKLNKKFDMVFDLPTDAEWEYACRAVTSTSLNSGKNLMRTTQDPNMAEVGRYYSNRSDGKGGYSEHTKVGCYKPNAWGLYDMHGNVCEWCLDWWGSSTFSNAPVTDPCGMANGTTRVMRGGSWIDYAQHCRSALRRDFNPSTGYHYYGFRLVCFPSSK